MKNENYLYFADSGQNDQAGDGCMWPASNLYGLLSKDEDEIEAYFAPRDNTSTTGDISALTIPVDSHKEVMEEFCSLASSSRANTNNFVVIADMNTNLPTNEGPISAKGISSVTAVANTTA